MYPSEYLSYGLGSSADIVTTPTGVKTFKLSDHLGSTRTEITEGGATASWDYEPYGEPITGPAPRTGFIDREEDKESGLGGFGVRKYDSETGRFLSTDPLLEEYREWTPYQYALNSPVNAIDPKGDSVIVILDDEGAGGVGHVAVLIGNSEDGWDLYSKNGTDQNRGIYGPSVNPDIGVGEDHFDSFIDFAQDDDHQRFDHAFLLKTSFIRDGLMRAVAKREALEGYNVLTNNCLDLVLDVLGIAGFDRAESTFDLGNAAPDTRYDNLMEENNGEDYTTNLLLGRALE